MALLDHEGGTEFPYSKDDVFDAVESAATSLSMKVNQSDKLSGHILIKSGMSLMSWGENIPVSVFSGGIGFTRVSVVSTPKTGVMLGGVFDLGKNRRNVEKILMETSRLLALREKNGAIVRLKEREQTEAHPTARLSNLEELKSNGLISEAEYEEKRKSILEAL